MAEFKIDDYLYINPEEVKLKTLEWLGERQAQKRFSKDIDVVAIKDGGFYGYKSSKILHNLIDDQNLMDEIFYKTEKYLSFNNGQTENAHAVWLIDQDGKDPIIRLADKIIKISEFKNRVYEIEIELDQIKGSNEKNYLIIEKRNKDYIERYLADNEGKKIKKENFNDLPKEIKEKLDELNFLGKEKWTGDFEPFVYIKNNPDGKSDRNFIETELDDLVTIIQKKRDDINYSSVKIVTVGARTQNERKESNNSEAVAEKNAKKMAATSVIISDNLGLEGSPTTSINTQIPNTDVYDRAIRTTLNTILKKTGGATDVDSKGTVQQSKGEVLLSQGDEFKVSNWKKTHRQKKIKELFIKIWKTYTQVLKNSSAFANIKNLQVFLSQEEVLSEREQLENAKLATELGISEKLLIKARYHNLTIVDMFEFENIKFEGITDGK